MTPDKQYFWRATVISGLCLAGVYGAAVGVSSGRRNINLDKRIRLDDWAISYAVPGAWTIDGPHMSGLLVQEVIHDSDASSFALVVQRRLVSEGADAERLLKTKEVEFEMMQEVNLEPYGEPSPVKIAGRQGVAVETSVANIPTVTVRFAAVVFDIGEAKTEAYIFELINKHGAGEKERLLWDGLLASVRVAQEPE